MAGFFKKLNRGTKKTRDNFSGNIDNVLDAFDEIGDDLYEELTEVLVMSDVGVYTSEKIITELQDRVKKENVKDPAEVRRLIKEIVADMLGEDEKIDFVTTPAVILVIGVNGVGKTTTIGKMAHYFRTEGKTVYLGAADTFRAAAIDQLEIWADRAGVDIVKHDEGSDPASVVFDTINVGVKNNADVLICDTAGRIHNKKGLMDELGKIYRVIDRELPYSDREIFLVLDASTGQNAISQAKEFMNVADISGIVLTKLDGTARGGVVLAIKEELKLPVKFIGVGEGIDDLQPFSATAFAESLFEPLDEAQEEGIEATLNENLQMEETDEVAPLNLGKGGAEEPAEAAPQELTKKEQKQAAKEAQKAAKAAAAEQKAKEEEKARRKAEQKAREQAKKEQRAREQAEAEARAKAEAEAKARAEAEAKRKAEEEARRKAEEEARRKAEKEARAKAEAEAKARAEAEAKAKAEAEAKAKAEEEARIEAERVALEREFEEERKRAEAEARARREARARAEEEARAAVAQEEARRQTVEPSTPASGNSVEETAVGNSDNPEEIARRELQERIAAAKAALLKRSVQASNDKKESENG